MWDSTEETNIFLYGIPQNYDSIDQENHIVIFLGNGYVDDHIINYVE